MKGDVYYLKDPSGCVVAKFVVENEDYHCLMGHCYSCVSWDADNNIPLEYLFVTDAYCKWDGCTHWNFCGEDYNDDDPINAYYHLCGDLCFRDHIRYMCFVWKLASMLIVNEHYQEYTDTEYLGNPETQALIDLMLNYVIEKGEKE